jgi:large exoprotein involved in heme utilization and adhesion
MLKVGTLTLTGGARIITSTRGPGRGGELTVVATDAISITGGAQEGFPSGLFSRAEGSGDAGRLSLSTPLLTLDAGRIQGVTSGDGHAGDIELKVGSLRLTGGAFIDSGTSGGGRGGELTVAAADTIAMTGPGSGLFSNTFGSGDAGRITVSTPLLTLDEGLIQAATASGSRGNAGDIDVRVGRLTLAGGGQITTSTRSSGRGGNMTVTATDMIAIAGRDRAGTPSGLASRASAGGDAGQLSIATPRLTLSGGGLIDSSTRGSGRGGVVRVMATEAVTIAGRNREGFPSVLASGTSGRGPGGNIEVRARDVQLSDGGTIAARSTGEGAAGTLQIQAGEIFRSHQGRVTTDSARAGGGRIELHAGSLVLLRESELTTTVQGGGGDAGDLTVAAPLIVSANSQLIANAFAGQGGNIRLGAEVFLADPASLVRASSALGIQGTVEIRAPVTTLSGTVAPLPQAFVNVAALLPARCAARLSGGKVSSLVLGGRDGLPADPSGVLPSPLVLEERLAADPAVMGARHQQLSPSRFALLAGQEKALPWLGCPK